LPERSTTPARCSLRSRSASIEPGDLRQAAVQVVETAAGPHQVADDQQVPPVRDGLGRDRDRAVRRVDHVRRILATEIRRQ
jgi:hypothetical protein